MPGRALGRGHMEGLMLVLVLWVSVVSLELKKGKMKMSASNLSCFQCFKVSSMSQCLPAVCRPTEKVCVSHKLVFSTNVRKKAQISKRCAPRCPSNSSSYEWMLTTGVQAKIVRGCCSKNLCNKAASRQEELWVSLAELLPLVGLSFLWTLL
ncbi:lymphocyte antigen 6L [Octodon degus]|uniref:Lymphocyte antigen 6L n=1 Tax=Octodon degus TaxID=10160 RepID=A0A6P3VCC4_OCTDE|nr:lymphocyte antigen 6L [Octodon degus]